MSQIYAKNIHQDGTQPKCLVGKQTGEVTKHCFPSNMEMMAHVLLDGYEAKGTWWPTRNEQTGIPMWFQTLWLMFVYFSF